MFFSQIVLAKRGPLGRIWLAGHWDKKIAKNVVFATNIPKSIKHILHPHLPMALRMTSHLLLGVVRIFSKKAKYLLNDCTEAVTKLKGLTKQKSTKIDLPSAGEVEGQSIIAAGPTTKPQQVFKDVDRFLRNIDIRDLVVDSFYDPSKTNPEQKQQVTYTSEYQTPEAGQGTILGQRSAGREAETGESLSKKYKEDMDLRGASPIPLISPAPLGPGMESPHDIQSPIQLESITKPHRLEILQGELYNPSIGSPDLHTPDDLRVPDGESGIEFKVGFQPPGKLIFESPKKVQEGVDVVIPSGYEEEHHFQPVSPIRSPLPPPEGDFTKLSGDEGVEEEKKTKPTAAKKRKTRTGPKSISLTRREIRKFEDPSSLNVEKKLLPYSQTQIVARTKGLTPKDQLLAPVRIGMAERLNKFYAETLQFQIPAIIGINSVLPLSYLRGKRSYYVVREADRETQFLTSNTRTSTDLGIPQYQDYNVEEEKKREKVLLDSINNRDLENERSPQSVPSVQPENPNDKSIYEDLFEEIKLRGEQGSALFYSAGSRLEDSRDKLLRKSPGQLSDISPYKAVPMINENFSDLRSTPGGLKPLHELEVDFTHIGEIEPPPFPTGGYEEEYDRGFEPGQTVYTPQGEEREEDIQEREEKEKRFKEFREKQAADQRKKIWSQKTARMHANLDRKFKKVPTLNFLEDVLQGEDRKRTKAAGIFYELLILKTKDLIELNQLEPYGEISIKKAPNFDNTSGWKIVDELNE